MNRSHTIDDIGPSIVLLDCGRTMTFTVAPPKTGEQVYCFRHGRYERVVEGRAEYRVRCTNCRLSRPYGVARLTAELKAAQHARKHAHTVELRQGSKVVHTYAHDSGAQEDAQLSLDEDVPPF